MVKSRFLLFIAILTFSISNVFADSFPKRENCDPVCDSIFKRIDEIKVQSPKVAAGLAEEALAYGTEVGNLACMAEAYYQLANISNIVGDFGQAFDYGLKSLKIASSIQDTALTIGLYYRIGIIYFRMNRPVEADRFVKMAYDMASENGYNDMLPRIINGMGVLLLSQGYPDSSIQYFERSYESAEKEKQFELLADVYNNIGLAYSKQLDFEKAIYYSELGLKIATKNNDIEGMAEIPLNLSAYYVQMDQPQKAIESVESALVIARKSGMKFAISEGLYYLSYVYSSTGNYQKAYETQVEYKQYSDSLIGSQTQQTINELMARHALEEKERENEKLNQEKDLQEKKLQVQRTQKYGLLAGLIFLLFFVMYSYRNIRQKKLANELLLAKNQKIGEQKEELEKHRHHLEDLVKERTRDLEEAKLKAEESDRLKSAFLANMSHEIRTPINGILGFTELLQDEDLTPDMRMEYTGIIQSSVNQLLTLINDIIDISRIQAGLLSVKKDEFELKQMFDELQTFYSKEKVRVKREDLEVRYSMAPNIEEGFKMYTDRQRVRQLLTNLIGNALKFTHEGHIEFGCQRRMDGTMEFFVSDTGIGISKEKQEIIFDQFRQAEETTVKHYGGSGLGLSICNGILELLDGDIWVQSEEGKGSCFYFTIPPQQKKDF